jgi:GT2 family glycosyltransferase
VITASIVVHNAPQPQLTQALSCALGNGVDHVWVIDNSADDTLRCCCSSPRITYQRMENRGYGAGHNVGIRAALSAGSEFHLVMNADVCWTTDVIGPMVEYMHAHPDVGQMMPLVRYPDGALQYACRMLPTPFDLFARRLLPECLTRRHMDRYLLADADHSRPFNCPYLLGSFMFFRTAALQEAGLFDERFFLYPEDIDITRRLHRHWVTLFYPQVEIVHEHAAASRHSLRMFAIHAVNMAKYFNKWGWFFDRERRDFNRRLLATMPRLEGKPRPVARG